MLRLGTLVTLLVNKEHPNGDELNSGVSGMVVEANPNPDGSIRYVVDFGSSGQWNCTEEELSQEGLIAERPERVPEHITIPERDPGYQPVIRRKVQDEDDENPEKVLSFEEEMARLEGESEF